MFIIYKMTQIQINQLAEFYKILGDATRLKMLLLLKNRYCVSELAEMMEMAQPAISHHLSILKTMGLVKKQREGKNMYYLLNEDIVEKIVGMALEHIENE